MLLAVGLCMVSPIQRVRCAAVVAEVGSGSGSGSDFSGSGHASGSNDDDDGDDGDDGDEAQVVETTAPATPEFGPIKNGTQTNLTNATMPAATSTATADTGGVAGSDDDDDDDDLGTPTCSVPSHVFPFCPRVLWDLLAGRSRVSEPRVTQLGKATSAHKCVPKRSLRRCSRCSPSLHTLSLSRRHHTHRHSPNPCGPLPLPAAIGLGVGIPVGIVVLAGVAFLLHTQQSQDTNGGARSGSSYEAVPASVHARPNMPLTKPAPPYSSTTELDLSTRTSSYMEAHSANEAAANTGHVSYLV